MHSIKNPSMNGPKFFSAIITGDESWCYSNDPKTKQQSSQWKTPNVTTSNKSTSIEVEQQDHAVSLTLEE